MHTHHGVLVSAAIVAVTALGCVTLRYPLPEYHDPIVPIEVALEADRTPSDPSSAVKPHITVLQGFVREPKLHALTANVAIIMATTDLERLTVKTTGGSGPAITVDASTELRRLQERMAEGFGAFAVDPAEDPSLIATPDGSAMSGDAVYAIVRFIPDASGVNYRPRVVAGASQSPPAAGFRPVGAAVYQLDRTGLAARTLWTWTGESGAR